MEPRLTTVPAAFHLLVDSVAPTKPSWKCATTLGVYYTTLATMALSSRGLLWARGLLSGGGSLVVCGRALDCLRVFAFSHQAFIDRNQVLRRWPDWMKKKKKLAWGKKAYHDFGAAMWRPRCIFHVIKCHGDLSDIEFYIFKCESWRTLNFFTLLNVTANCISQAVACSTVTTLTIPLARLRPWFNAHLWRIITVAI